MRTPKCAKSHRSAARAAHCFLVCQVFRAPRPSGGRAIVAREVVQPLSFDKADDLMLFYCALCAAESRNGEARTHASRGMCRLWLCDLRMSMTMSTSPRRLASLLYVTLLLLNRKESLVEALLFRKNILAKYCHNNEVTNWWQL